MKPILALIFWTLATSATAQPIPYTLAPNASTVQFAYTLGNDRMLGMMPVQSADIRIDFETLSASTVSVAMNAAKARAGVIFATEAMRSASVLDTRNHPVILFESTRVSGTYSKAILHGNLTIRNVTHPVTLRGGIYRLRGSDPADLEDLTLIFQTTVSRTTFGAMGYPDLVGDQIGITITARIRK